MNVECKKSFLVFGEKVDLLVTGKMTNGASAVMVQTSPPGGGPPPHSHTNEDEFFQVLEGEFEFLSDDKWKPVARGELTFAPRGNRHAFRNCGTKDGKMMFLVAPAGLDEYLEAISLLVLPADEATLQELSKQFGIQFFV